MDIIYFTNDRIEFTDGHPSQGITKREMDAEVPEIVAAFRRKTTMYNGFSSYCEKHEINDRNRHLTAISVVKPAFSILFAKNSDLFAKMIDVSRQHSRREGTPFGGRQTHQSSEKRMDFGRLRRCKILDIFGNDASRIGPKLAVSLHFWAYFGSALCTLLWCNEQFGSSNSCNL